jgi:hypothetical protein
VEGRVKGGGGVRETRWEEKVDRERGMRDGVGEG